MVAETCFAEDVVKGATVGFHLQKFKGVDVDEKVVKDSSRDWFVVFQLDSGEVWLSNLDERLEVLVEDLCFRFVANHIFAVHEIVSGSSMGFKVEVPCHDDCVRKVGLEVRCSIFYELVDVLHHGNLLLYSKIGINVHIDDRESPSLVHDVDTNASSFNDGFPCCLPFPRHQVLFVNDSNTISASSP